MMNKEFKLINFMPNRSNLLHYFFTLSLIVTGRIFNYPNSVIILFIGWIYLMTCGLAFYLKDMMFKAVRNAEENWEDKSKKQIATMIAHGLLEGDPLVILQTNRPDTVYMIPISWQEFYSGILKLMFRTVNLKEYYLGEVVYMTLAFMTYEKFL